MGGAARQGSSPVAVISLLTAQVRVVQSPLKRLSHLSSFNRDGATSEDSLLRYETGSYGVPAPVVHAEDGDQEQLACAREAEKVLVDWAWDLQEKQAVEKLWLVEEEMLSWQESR